MVFKSMLLLPAFSICSHVFCVVRPQARRLQSFNHENVVKYIGASEYEREGEEGLPEKYILIERVSGGSLSELVTHFG